MMGFCSLFAQNRKKYNKMFTFAHALTNKNIAVTQLTHVVYKTKDAHSHGPSNINLGLFVVCSFDVCRASQPFPSVNPDCASHLSSLLADWQCDETLTSLLYYFKS